MRSAAAAVIAALVAAALVVAPTASPSPSLQVGIFDDGQVLYGQPEGVFRLMKTTGAKVVRVNLWWSGPSLSVATRKPAKASDPNDPAYNWDTYDRTVRFAIVNGMQPVFSIVGTPPWANGAKGWNVAPTKAADLRQFAIAAAKRYSGTFKAPDGNILPRVTNWLAWNEPNNPVFMKPQYRLSGSKWVIQSAIDYAKICNAIVQGIKSVAPKSKVACGVSAPRGNNNPSSSRPSVSPIAFARALKQAGAKGFDAYAHHPYYETPADTPSTKPRSINGKPPNAVTLGNLDTLIAEVTKLWGNKRFWITEYGYQTNPPDTFFGVSYAKQAAFLTQAVAYARRNPRIDMFLWFLMTDEARPDGWQSGLWTVDGLRKPAFAAFKRAAG